MKKKNKQVKESEKQATGGKKSKKMGRKLFALILILTAIGVVKRKVG